MTLIQELVFPDLSNPQEPISLIRAKLEASARLASVKFGPDMQISDVELVLNERIETAAARGDLKIYVQAANSYYHEIVQLYWGLGECAAVRQHALVAGRFLIPMVAVDPDAFCIRLANNPLFVDTRPFRRLVAPLRPLAYIELTRWIYNSLAKRNERITWDEFEALVERLIGATRAADMQAIWKALPQVCKLRGRPESGRLAPTVAYYTNIEELKADQRP
jgi:hypothetical protein